MKIMVFGAGAWGTALAVTASARHDVMLWARDPAQARALQSGRENRRYLPGILLPPSLAVIGDPFDQLGSVCAGADLAIIATPMAGLRQLLVQLRDHSGPLAWLCKGFEAPVGGGY